MVWEFYLKKRDGNMFFIRPAHIEERVSGLMWFLALGYNSYFLHAGCVAIFV